VKINTKSLKILIWTVAVPLLFALYWCVVGSFEMFPSDEDIAQGRLKAFILLVILGVIEGGLWLWHRYLQHKEREQT